MVLHSGRYWRKLLNFVLITAFFLHSDLQLHLLTLKCWILNSRSLNPVSLCLLSWKARWWSRQQGPRPRPRRPSLSPPYPARPYWTVPLVSTATSNRPKRTCQIVKSCLTSPGWSLQRYHEQRGVDMKLVV